MGKAIPTQHPAVVLRSHYRQLRGLLAIATIAVVGLTAAVVILANDGNEVDGTTSARPIESINYGGFNFATGRPDSAPLPRQESQGPAPGTRYDGGPEEGTAALTQRSAPATSDPNSIKEAPGVRYDGGPEEGTAAVSPAQPRPTQDQALPGPTQEAREATGAPAHGSR